ncbi:putative 2OG-Fe(II) oxygenase [Sphingomonas sp. LB-2]|uniref:putative 2OG-Fe(II) oxygenase n=1 Tax=Sphingomonas caeni TaxID=2984949 RepID=UPI00222EB70A|nr:putative 2OG-Fe(II) oxygenase [Sphingomonas caeni]MCW3846271.1 putative 2OG-Fe(II) oxygenase [Sphingomonas caeni]
MTAGNSPTLDLVALDERARQALANGEEEGALPLLAAAAERARDSARLWQWTALLRRALHRHTEALAAFERAAALDPADLSIAYGHAQTMMEAGGDARALFGRALMLDQGNGDSILGFAAARLGAGDGVQAADELEALLARNPHWVPGHSGLAQLRGQLGQRDLVTRSFETALGVQPDNRQLWDALIVLLFRAGRFAEAHEVLLRARRVLGGHAFAAHEVLILSELGQADAADARYAAVEAPSDLNYVVHRVRHLLRTGRAPEAVPLIERCIGEPGASLLWPYIALVWRITGDPRWEWLEGDARLVSVTDLTDRLPPLDRLAEVLREMHITKDQPLDQSLRGGTQTYGILFTRTEPEIVALRAAIVEAVAAHIAQLPPPDPAHPILGLRRDRPIRFSGGWSVRLMGGGHHVNHIHQLGWFSSALYVALPEAQGEQGWLTLGAPPAELGLDLAPLRTIAPRPGQLVLFPSTLWHGTLPFDVGERLTVAFDVAPPR